MPEFHRIRQIPVMRDCKSSFHIINDKRLRILSSCTACRRIPYMAYPKIPLQAFQAFFIKNLIDQPKPFFEEHFPLSIRIGHCNTAALLSTVLQSK